MSRLRLARRATATPNQTHRIVADSRLPPPGRRTRDWGAIEGGGAEPGLDASGGLDRRRIQQLFAPFRDEQPRLASRRVSASTGERPAVDRGIGYQR